MDPNAFNDPYLRLTSEKHGKATAWREIFGPMAVEKTFQAIGRLIRTPADYGVVAFLDPRAREVAKFRGLMAYDGSPVTSSLEAVRDHLEKFR